MDIRLPLLWILFATPLVGRTAEPMVPHELDGWRSWVLHGEEYRTCPFYANETPGEPGAHRCAWPGRLQLSVDARGGSFNQSWKLYAESWIALPGSGDLWPENVRIDGADGAVVSRDGKPMARLPAGEHRIEGRFGWTTRPESLPIPTDTGIVDLSVDGHAVVQPERSDAGIGLGRQKVAVQARALEVQVYRLLEDNIPANLTTIVRLQVAGDAREEVLSQLLPDGFAPVAMNGALPARLDASGRLRVQVRAGSWELIVSARGHDVAGTLQRPPLTGTWAREEIWSFAGNDQLRIAATEGAMAIDPSQANVPRSWVGYPAFRMAPDTRLTVTERSRGLSNVDDNRLRIERQLWLDFDHAGFTAVDTISGSMRRDWRLDMQRPFRLAAARIGADSLLVTEGRSAALTGVELRSPAVNLSTTARIEQSDGSIPASGWGTRFELVSGILNLAPGHRLLAVGGADYAPGAWLDRWGLWNLFGVLVLVVFIAWIAGRGVGALALAALVLMYQEEPGIIWVWGNLLIATAAARAAPTARLRHWAQVYRSVSVALLGVVLVPLLASQLRLALYPQLDVPRFEAVSPQMIASIGAPLPMAAPAPAAPPSPVEMDEAVLTAKKSQAPAPASALSSAGASRRRNDNRAYAASAMSMQQMVQRYAPGTLLQTGPGLPSWHYVAYRYGWTGPVEPTQQVHFYYIGPFLLALWRIVGVSLTATLFVLLFRSGGMLPWRLGPTGTASAGTAMLAMFAVMLAAPPVRAASTPDAALLEELHTRLAAPPVCAPTCAEVMAATVKVSAQRLDVELHVSALASLAIAVPSANDRWQIESITLDGVSTLTLARDARGSLWVPLARGSHTIKMSGRTAADESIQLAFPMTPRHISVAADGWDAAGLSESHLPSGTLELVPRRAARLRTETSAEQGDADATARFPPFVRVVRNFNLDLDWSIETSVQRIAPERAGFTILVPLIANESVLSAGVTVRDHSTSVGIGAGEAGVNYSSGLSRSETLNLELPTGADRTEVWSFRINPQWNVSFNGIPAVLPEGIGSADWVYEFHPRPGERLSVAIHRPKPIAGPTLAIDSVREQSVIGMRSTNSELQLSYRSTEGGRHAIGLPADARVTAVAVDGQSVPLRPEKGELLLSLLPGAHRVNIAWSTEAGATLDSRPDPVELHAAASNIETRLNLPENRWPLAAWGSGVGPAVLYWGELCVFVVIAIALGRTRWSPLRIHEWLLLGLGLSTLSWGVFSVVAIWLFAMHWRQQWKAEPVKRLTFNAVQMMLAAITVIAVTGLIFSGIRYGLLAHPDMSIAGPGFTDGAFEWFNDQTASQLPAPTVISVPMWIYKTLIFAWALWIALALRRWLSFAWRAWTANGSWRGKAAVVTP